MFASLVGSSTHGSGKTHKHGSSHKSHRSSTGHSKGTKTKSSRTAVPDTISLSFLFVVNELQVDYEPLPGEEYPSMDQWFNTAPPQRASAYTGEIPGTVFRYHNGVISPAHGYVWHRPEWGRGGRIVRINQANIIDGQPLFLRAQTVFACSPLLPMIVADEDASLGFTFMRRLCPNGCDRTYDENYSAWSYLHFGGENESSGISYVYSGASGNPWAAGKDASWVPSLVPSVYRNTDPSAPVSRGLSGHLSTIIALMGFHGKPGRASEVFRDRKWHLGQWVGSSRASNYLPKTGESPRGLFVQVCADNIFEADYDENSIDDIQEQILQDLECRTILVHG